MCLRYNKYTKIGIILTIQIVIVIGIICTEDFVGFLNYVSKHVFILQTLRILCRYQRSSISLYVDRCF